jgi:MFS transporter, ACS family, hexuronate transporter
MFPKRAVGSIVGIGGMAGSIGGMLFATSAGFLLEWTGSYMTLFIISGSVYLIALLIFQFLVPKIKTVEIN